MNLGVALANCKAAIKKLNAVLVNKGWLFQYMNFVWLLQKNSQNCLVELQLIDPSNGSTHCSLWSKNWIFMNTLCNVLVVTKWVIESRPYCYVYMLSMVTINLDFEWCHTSSLNGDRISMVTLEPGFLVTSRPGSHWLR